MDNNNGFFVICVNPKKSAAIQACWFGPDWSVVDAMEQFATDHGLESAEVAVEYRQ